MAAITKKMTIQQKIIYEQLLGRYVKITWTHKIHECQADICFKQYKWDSRIVRVLTSATSAGVILALTESLSPYWVKVITALVAMALNYYTLTRKEVESDRKAIENKRYAALHHDLRNKYESLLTDIKAETLTNEQIAERRNLLEERENEIYIGNVPKASSKACALADKALKQGKESTTEEEEIKLIVPDYLQL